MRYSRQEILSEIGTEGQTKLATASVAIIGVGALGTVATELLVRAGVGNILLIDRDVIEESNLQRQTLFTEADVGKSKAVAAKERLCQINSVVDISFETVHLDQKNIALLRDYDLILDCTDNLQTRFLLDDYCRKEKKKWIYAAAITTSGYVMPIVPGGPCLRDFIQESSGLDTCDTVGVLNTITTSIASLQVTFALKLLTGKDVEQYLYFFDVWDMVLKKIEIKNSETEHDFRFLQEHTAKITRFCATGKYQLIGMPVDFSAIRKRWGKTMDVQDDGVTLRIENITLFKDGRVLIDAQTKEEAQSLYDKFVGR